MFGVTLPQRAMSVAAAALALVISVAAAFAEWRVAIAAAGLLLGLVGVLQLDLRRRSGDITRRLRLLEGRMAASIESNKEGFGQTRKETAQSLDRLRRQTEGGLKSVTGRIGDVARAVSDQRLRELVVAPLKDYVRSQTNKLHHNQIRETEGLLQLFARVESGEPMPPSGDWALNPQGLLSLYTLVERHRPRVVVELGSGSSTVWLGHALAATGGGDSAPRLISLEHDEYYARESRAAVRLHGNSVAHTEVRMAPLTSVLLGGEEFQWYDPNALSDVDAIDLLIVDGPPGNTGPQARYPAVPMLWKKLADRALVVLEDANRRDEAKIAQRWIEEVPGLVRESSRTDRQIVLRYSTATSSPDSAEPDA